MCNQEFRHWEIIIVSLPDREKLVAEIWIDNQLWIEISQEDPSNMEIMMFPREDETLWKMPYEKALGILQQAQKKLLGE